MYHPGLGRWMTQDPIGFDAGDPNLFRYVANTPINAIDPTGLDKVDITWGRQNVGTETGKLNWAIVDPKPPKGLKITTHVQLRWSVSGHAAARAKTGTYEFWFNELVSLGKFEFHLTPHHGSQLGANNKFPLYPIFPGATPGIRNRELDEYLGSRLNTHGSSGELTFRIEYRGYKVSCTEEFHKPVEEIPGPVWEPTFYEEPPTNQDRQYYMPNWIRSKPLPRTKYPWLDKEPAIWGAFDPSWSYVKELTLSWSPVLGGTAGSYRLIDGNNPPVEEAFERYLV